MIEIRQCTFSIKHKLLFRTFGIIFTKLFCFFFPFQFIINTDNEKKAVESLKTNAGE